MYAIRSYYAAEYVASPAIKGLLEGYNTMDTFGALMFGMLIIDVLKEKGITDKRLQTRYLMRAGIMAATGLALVYIALVITSYSIHYTKLYDFDYGCQA